MIIPILKGLMHWKNAPVTWAIVMLNVIVLCLSLFFGHRASDELEDLLAQDYFVDTQGRAYAQYLNEKTTAQYPQFILDLAEHVMRGENSRVNLLGQLAFRDNAFLTEAMEREFRGDMVAFRFWKSKLDWAKKAQEEHPSFILGLNSEDSSLSKWVTYIFIHSGWFHLLGNMLFLLLFGAALERQVGGLATLVVFVLSGVLGAGAFALVTGVTSSPLVGASGAVSGIMTLFCFLNWRRPIRFVYWLFLPIRGYMGLVYLPCWVAFAMWFVSDVAGYLSAVPELGGVAHTAHIGGEFAGFVVGMTVYLMRRHLPGLSAKVDAAVLDEEDKRLGKIGVLYPFLPPRKAS